MMTLEQLNQQVSAWRAKQGTSDVKAWGPLTLRAFYAVGKAGGQNARRGAFGDKGHLLTVEEIIADAAPKGRGYMTTGDHFKIQGCNTNGQHTGIIVPNGDLEHVTCKKCLAKLARIIANTTPAVDADVDANGLDSVDRAEMALGVE